MTSWLLGAAVLAAVVAAWAVQQRQGVFLLGKRGAVIAPAYLTALWLVGLSLGQGWGTLVGMAWTAALPLVVLAGFSWRRFPARRHRVRAWTVLDLAAWLHLSESIALNRLHDVDCHQAIVSNYLRGNIPPSALNDPASRLVYHALYDAVVALVVQVVPLDLEAGMDLVTSFFVGLTILTLVAVTRSIFRTRAAAQAGRILFLFGFGPVFVRWMMPGGNVNALHGSTTQVYADMLLRRPTALTFALYTLSLALLLQHYGRGRAGVPAPTRPHPALMLPVLALLPHSSEELVLFVVVIAVPLVVRRRVSWPWVVACAAVLGLSAATAGVFAGVLGGSSMATPGMAMAWPPALPSWNTDDKRIPLLSADAGLFFLLELGPIFLATLVLVFVRRLPRQMALALPFLVGLPLVTLVELVNWTKADLDRFLFCGTPLVFMLCASWIDVLVPRRGRESVLRWLGRGSFATVLTLLMAGPSVYWAGESAKRAPRGALQDTVAGDELRTQLRAVGPREAVITTLDHAQELVLAGFIVIAPMTNNFVGSVTGGDGFSQYVESHRGSARWLFLPASDPRTKGKVVRGVAGDYLLVSASEKHLLVPHLPDVQEIQRIR